ncbi:MAG: DUF4388 domain-containing protein, partial [Dictyoglomus sp.]
MSLNGDLRSISLWEVMEILSFSRKTGRLQLTRDKIKTDVYFEDGKIKHIKASNCEDEDAILHLALWKEGNFAFYPEEKAPVNKLNLDPLRILVDVSKDIDLMEYLGDLVFLFINVSNLSEEEKNVGLLFDGLKPTRDVILNSPYGEAKTLRLIEKLRENRNLLRIDENLNLFWTYTFWRYFIFTLERENEKDFRKKWADHLNKISPNYKLVFEILTRDKRVEWFNIYPLIKDSPTNEYFKVIKDVFYFIESYRKLEVNNVIDAGKIIILSQDLEPKMSKIYVPIKYSDIIEENIVLWFFDGKRFIKDILDILPFGDLRKLQLVKSVLDKKLVLSLGENIRIDLLNYFFMFWQEITEKLNKISKREEFVKIWDNFIYESLSDVKHLFSYLPSEHRQNFPYFFRNIAQSQEEELRMFLKEATKVLLGYASKVLP